jgi:hypothetical protein
MLTDLYIDIGAEKVLAAERHGEKIAVEIKSFASISVLFDFHLAVGQFINYRVALEEVNPDRILYLAVPIETYDSFFRRRFVQSVIEREHLKIVVYDAVNEVITEWKVERLQKICRANNQRPKQLQIFIRRD